MIESKTSPKLFIQNDRYPDVELQSTLIQSFSNKGIPCETANDQMVDILIKISSCPNTTEELLTIRDKFGRDCFKGFFSFIHLFDDTANKTKHLNEEEYINFAHFHLYLCIYIYE